MSRVNSFVGQTVSLIVDFTDYYSKLVIGKLTMARNPIAPTFPVKLTKEKRRKKN